MTRILSILFAFLLLTTIVSCTKQKDSSGTVVKKPAAARSKILTGVKVTSLRVDSFARYDKSGEKWDSYAPLSENPDVFLTLSLKESRIYKSETIEECVFGLPVDLKSGIPLQLKPFDQPLLLEVFDEDGVSAHDNMGYILFNPMDYKDWKTVVLKSEKDQLAVTLTLEWQYE